MLEFRMILSLMLIISQWISLKLYLILSFIPSLIKSEYCDQIKLRLGLKSKYNARSNLKV